MPFQKKKSMQPFSKSNPVLVIMTAASEKEARMIGQRLLEEKLAACVNLISGMQSLFVWKGKICDEKEIPLLVKSRQDLLPRVISLVKELHRYEVPEIVALPIVGGSEDYLQWWDESLI